MRFRLILQPTKPNQKLTFNYNYPIEGMIYGLLKDADEAYANFLHNQGYAVNEKAHKTFKHFTFSKINIPKNGYAKRPEKGEDFILLGNEAVELIVSFYVNEASEKFISGLFMNQRISIHNKKYEANFTIKSVEVMPTQDFSSGSVVLRATSPMTIANAQNTYLMPTDSDFARIFAVNLVSKYVSIYHPESNITDLVKAVKFELIDDSSMKSKKVFIKEDRTDGTEVRGFENFTFKLTAPKDIIEVGFYGGFGKSSGTGFGFCVAQPSDVEN